jgi:hypothetical protein
MAKQTLEDVCIFSPLAFLGHTHVFERLVIPGVDGLTLSARVCQDNGVGRHGSDGQLAGSSLALAGQIGQ